MRYERDHLDPACTILRAEAFVSENPRAVDVFSDWVHPPQWYERWGGQGR